MRLLFCFLFFGLFGGFTCHAQEAAEARIKTLETRLQKLEKQVEDADVVWSLSMGGSEQRFSFSMKHWQIYLLFGVTCGLWAQNNMRSVWLWFFLGFIAGPLAALLTLIENGRLRRAEREKAALPQ